jgi:hypothetical protein
MPSVFCLSVSYFFLAANIIALYSGSGHLVALLFGLCYTYIYLSI